MKNRFVLSWVIIVTVILTLEIVGRYLGLLFHPSLGYDKVLHFLAGGACGIFGVGLIWQLHKNRLTSPSKSEVWIFAMFAALVLGILWEILQAYVPAMRDASDYDWYDTVGDVIFDTMGGVVTALVYQEKN